MRKAIIRHCANSNEFKNLAGGLVEDADKEALISTLNDRFATRFAKIKPDLGIQFASDIFKNKDHNALVLVVEKASNVIDVVVDGSNKFAPSPAAPFNRNHTLGINDVRINFMRVKPVKVLDTAKKRVEMINLGGIFERGNKLLPEIFTNGTPEIQMIKEIVPEVVKEAAPELIKGAPEAAKNVIHIKDGFEAGKFAAKNRINFRPRFF